ncbi:MAG: DUF5060 domain-containing protein [Cyclobacteriaceae bacterium]
MKNFSQPTCFLLLLIIGITSSCQESSKVNITGELKKWHKVSLVFEGPETSELDENNPFLNYRLDVTFSNGNEQYVVPGYYAADGNAAETSADSGNQWVVNFTPNETGEWSYIVSFKQGANIAIADDPSTFSSAEFMDGLTGSFVVIESDKAGLDNRAKGRLQYVGEPYLKYAETGDYFIKLGVDAPENLLAYEDIDSTTNVFEFRKSWGPHAGDFEDAAKPFLWQGSKGKNLMGALKYLASEELNVFSFLTFNVDGDDRNIFPQLLKVPFSEYETYANVKKNKEAWETYFHKTRFDVSKLEQWERIFGYAETLGMFLHFKSHETETDHLMDQGVFGTEGKLYYRELIARFGHHLALNWNLGEENNQPIEEVIKAANYVYGLDPYKHHLVMHTFPNQDDRYASLIGDQSPLTGASIQLSDPEFDDVHDRVLKWKFKTDSVGKPWALAVDEPGSARYALLPDDEDMEHNDARGNAMYGTLFAGGYGLEWYFGYDSPNSDLTCQDFRSRDLFWDQNRYARRFFENEIPFWRMSPADELTADDLSYCLAEKGEIYVVYKPIGLKNIELDLRDTQMLYDIKWYDPRAGGELVNGSVTGIGGGKLVSVGNPPSAEELDWIVVVKSTGLTD